VSTSLIDPTPSSRPPAALTALPASRAAADPTGDCLIDDSRTIDNAAFEADVSALAARFADLGIGVGDVVAVLLPNRCEIVTIMFAAWRRGAALTPVNPALTDDEVTYQLLDSDTRVLVGDERSARLAVELQIFHVEVETIHPATGHSSPVDLAPLHVAPAREDHALIVYTSGTTGRPKGCVLDHGNVESMVGSIVEHFTFGPDDKSLLVLPLFHCNGLLVGVLSMLSAGGCIVVGPRFEPAAFWDAVARHRPTYFSAVPTMYALLHAHADREVDTSSLKFAICGAAPMSAELIGRFEETFGFPLVEGYGLSECSVAATINPLGGPRKAGTVGPALPHQIVAIEDHLGNHLPAGESGEVVIKGPNVMRGYLGRPEDTAKVLHDGWLHTGDVGYVDKDNNVTITDRIKDMFIVGGFNAYPAEIEGLMLDHPDLAQVAIVGVPDARMGEVGMAFVVPTAGHTVDADEVLAWAREHMANFKVPRHLEVVDALPLNASGKVLKFELRERGRELTGSCSAHGTNHATGGVFLGRRSARVGGEDGG